MNTKNTKKLFKYFIMLFLIIIPFLNVKADSIITIGRENLTVPAGTHRDTNYYNLATNTGTPLFCLDRGLGYSGNAQYNLIEEITSPSDKFLCAVIKIGRNNNGSLPYNALQEAIWDAEAGSSTYTGCSFTTAKGVTCDAQTVKNTYDTTKVLKEAGSNPSVDFSLNNATLSLTSDEKYYVSKSIIVSATGEYTFDISNLPDGSLLSRNSDCTSTLTSPTTVKTIYACIPSTSNFSTQSYTLKASISAVVTNKYEYETVTVYNTRTCYRARTAESASLKVYWRDGTDLEGKEHQKLAIPKYTPSTGGESYSNTPAEKRELKTTTDTKNVTDDATLSLNVPLGAMKITKINEETKKVVEGAKFKLYRKLGNDYIEVTQDAKGNVIDIVTKEDGTYTVSNLTYGTYKLVEYEPALGYENDKVEIPDIKVDDIITQPIFVANTPISTIISKKDISNEEELKGAHIIITDDEDQPILDFISDDEPNKFYLGPGKYKLIEEASPEGYDRVETVFEFEILKSGEVKLISPTESKDIKTKNNEIILYNKVTVEVPDTGKNSTLFYVIGLSMAIAGTAIVLLTIRKQKVNKI